MGGHSKLGMPTTINCSQGAKHIAIMPDCRGQVKSQIWTRSLEESSWS